MENNTFKSAFIALLGSANAGKSTLVNALVGAKVAIVSKKAQTTRNRITGVLTTSDWQMVFVDTPGIHTPQTLLGEYMVKSAEQAARDVDAVVFIVDAKPGARERDREILSSFPKEMPVLIAINKIDAVPLERVDEIEESLQEFGRKTYRLSAKNGTGVPALLESLKSYLKEGPMFYPDDTLTDQSDEMLVSELIREKALKHLGKEVPHGVGVEIEKMEWDGAKEMYRIDAAIYTEKESHKGIIIGAGGRTLKKIASEARVDIEEVFGEKVFLQVFVKVRKDWRNKASVLRTLGYE